jgi:hypothetical protein
MPFLLLITFSSGIICYFLVHLHPGFTHFLFFALNLYASVTVVESLMMVIASVVPNFLMGIIIGAGIQVKFINFLGRIRQKEFVFIHCFLVYNRTEMEIIIQNFTGNIYASVRLLQITKGHPKTFLAVSYVIYQFPLLGTTGNAPAFI